MIQEQKHLSEITFEEAFNFRAKLQRELEQIQRDILYWSGICDYLKDKEFQETEKSKANS